MKDIVFTQASSLSGRINLSGWFRNVRHTIPQIVDTHTAVDCFASILCHSCAWGQEETCPIARRARDAFLRNHCQQ